jgi:hypothetical protein
VWQQYFEVGPGRPCQLYVIIVGDHSMPKSTSTTTRLIVARGLAVEAYQLLATRYLNYAV